MDYPELINTLRMCASGKRTPRCDTGEDGCFYGLMLEAADAIEELSEALEHAKLYSEVWESFANEVKDKYQTLVESLTKVR